MNNKNVGDYTEASSSSIVKSPYNLRRNQTQPGAVTKRNHSVTSRKGIPSVAIQSVNHDANSSSQRTPLHRSRQENTSIPSARRQRSTTPSPRQRHSSNATYQQQQSSPTLSRQQQQSSTASFRQQKQSSTASSRQQQQQPSSATSSRQQQQQSSPALSRQQQQQQQSSTASSRQQQQPSSAASSRQQQQLSSTATPRQHRSSATPIAVNRAQRQQQSSSEDEQSDENMQVDVVDRSDDEQEARLVKQRVERERNKLPLVREHFQRIDDNAYSCGFCKKLIKVSFNSDANLRSHLGRAHQMFDVMYNSQRHRRTLSTNKMKSERKKEIDEAALDCIITDGRAFGDLRRKGMSKLLITLCPGYRAPNRKTIRRRLGLAYHTYREELRTALASVDAIALTVDLWTKRKTSFICLTGHVFNGKYQSVPLVLGFRRIAGSHRADRIKNYIEYEVKALEIEDKICAIVSDNGSDIKKAINDIQPGKRLSCFAHNTNLVVQTGLELCKKIKKKKKQSRRTTTESFDTNSESDEADELKSDCDQGDIPEELEEEEEEEEEEEDDYETEDNDESENDDQIEAVGENENDDQANNDEESDGAVSPTDDDDFNDKQSENEDEDGISGEVFEPKYTRQCGRRLVKRVRSCIRTIRHTRAIVDYVNYQGKCANPSIKVGLVTDFEVRWNTTFIMLDRFSMYHSIIDNMNSRPARIPDLTVKQQLDVGSKKFEFTNDDWDKVNDLRTALQPFLTATNIISAKNYPTLATAYSVEYALRHFLSESSDDDSIWLKGVKRCLHEKFEHYFDVRSIDEEIGHYISSINPNQNIKFSDYWYTHEEQLPRMSAIVRRVNVIPASSVPCESTFSIAGYIRRKERSSLSPTAMKYTLVLKGRENLKLIQN